MSFFDDVLTERITVEARKVHFWRTVLTVFVLAWCGAALRVGWHEAHSTHQN
jgi:hypothetical protein